MNKEASKFSRCAVLTAETLLQGKWRVHILCAMRSGPVRIGELARMIPKASKKMLGQNLRDLEAAGIITRTDLSDVVLHIEYDLRPDLKEGVLLLLNHLAQWGDFFFKEGTVTDSSTAQEPRRAPPKILQP